MCGGMGYTKELPTGRLLADALLYKVGAGTQEVRRTLIGRSFSEPHSSVPGTHPRIS